MVARDLFCVGGTVVDAGLGLVRSAGLDENLRISVGLPVGLRFGRHVEKEEAELTPLAFCNRLEHRLHSREYMSVRPFLCQRGLRRP